MHALTIQYVSMNTYTIGHQIVLTTKRETYLKYVVLKK